jgi:hypothetical protein
MIHLGHHEPDDRDPAVLDERRAAFPADLSWWRRWWRRWRWIRDCRRARGHCWNPADAMIAWACCECPAETDGMPPDRCTTCRARRERTRAGAWLDAEREADRRVWQRWVDEFVTSRMTDPPRTLLELIGLPWLPYGERW